MVTLKTKYKKAHYIGYELIINKQLIMMAKQFF